MTPERLEYLLRLERIFMPLARQRRDEFLRIGQPPLPGPSPRFVHYTSAENAFNIIRSRQLWLRNATCMVDFSEMMHGYQLLGRFVSDENRFAAFAAALDAVAQGIGKEAVEAFDQRWHSIYLSTYIASVSEHDVAEDDLGRLSMWRAFGNAGPRVALVINLPIFTGVTEVLRLVFSPVNYFDDRDVNALLQAVLTNINSERGFLSALSRRDLVDQIVFFFFYLVTSVKHKGFTEEREWRAIHTPKLLPSETLESDVHVVGGLPQTVYKVPLDSSDERLASLRLPQIFDRLIVGPTPYPIAMADAFRTELIRAGVANPRVVASTIPLRS